MFSALAAIAAVALLLIRCASIGGGRRPWSGTSTFQDLLAAVSENCPVLDSALETGMRAFILAFALGLAFAASSRAAPLAPKMLDPATYLLDQGMGAPVKRAA